VILIINIILFFISIRKFSFKMESKNSWKQHFFLHVCL